MFQPTRRGSLFVLELVALLAVSCDATPELAGGNQFSQTVGTEQVYDEFETADPNWFIGRFRDGEVRIEDGEMLVRSLTASGASVSAMYDANFSDVIVDVDVRLNEGTDDNWQTVECRAEGNNYYDLGISADGYYLIAVWIDGVHLDKSLGPTGSPHIRTGEDAVNSLHVECIGDRLSLSVNGNLLSELTDANFTEGAVGLSVHALAGALSEAAFDNFRVAAP